MPKLTALLRERLPEQAGEIVRRGRKILEHRFDLLGFEDLDYGKEIDWHLDKVHGKSAPRLAAFRVKYLDFEQVGDAKVTWELNRHQHLVVLAKAYLLTGDERFTSEILAQWYSWQTQNPYPIGINWASTLEVAFRSLSWLWVRALLEGSSVVPAEFRNDLNRALALSGRHIERYLSTYFSPNTHLLGEAAALFFIGTACPEAVQSEHWRELGWRVVTQEAKKQVRDDGFYFEQSAYYHVYALDFFLQCGLLASRNDTPPPEYAATVERMCSSLALLSRTGISASFGDDDGGRVIDGQRNRAANLTEPLATAAVVFNRGDFKSLDRGLNEDVIWLLGAEGVEQFDVLKSKPPQYSSFALEASGLYLMASANPVPQQLLVDAGPQGAGAAGHGHADALSIQLLYGGSALLRDSGTLEYVGDTSNRATLRGTAAHSTMTVDGLGQSQPVEPFTWDRLTHTQREVWIAGEHFDLFRGSHDGYAALGVTHRRWVFHLPGRFWFIRDVASGHGLHKLELAWHLGGDLEPSDREARFFGRSGGDYGLEIVGCAGDAWKRELHPTWWSPVYGRREGAWTLRSSIESELPAESATILVPLASHSQPGGTLRSLSEIDAAEVRGYIYEVEQEHHGFFFRQTREPWMHAGWASDAEFIYYRADSQGLRDLYFYNGSYVEVAGKRVVSARDTVAYCQLVTRGDTTYIVSPFKDQIVLQQPLIHTAVGRDVALTGGRDRTGR